MAKQDNSTKGNDAPPVPQTTVVRKKRAPNLAVISEREAARQWKAAGNKGLPQEIKVAAFKRLAVPRTKRALKAIAALRALSNRAQYSYTQDDAAKIMTAIGEALAVLDKAFEPKGAAAKEFTL